MAPPVPVRPPWPRHSPKGILLPRSATSGRRRCSSSSGSSGCSRWLSPIRCLSSFSPFALECARERSRFRPPVSARRGRQSSGPLTRGRKDSEMARAAPCATHGGRCTRVPPRSPTCQTSSHGEGGPAGAREPEERMRRLRRLERRNDRPRGPRIRGRERADFPSRENRHPCSTASAGRLASVAAPRACVHIIGVFTSRCGATRQGYSLLGYK